MAGFAWLIQLSKAFSENKTSSPAPAKKKNWSSRKIKIWSTNQACKNLKSAWDASSWERPRVVMGRPGVRTARFHLQKEEGILLPSPGAPGNGFSESDCVGWEDSWKKILKISHAVKMTVSFLQLYLYSVGYYPRLSKRTCLFSAPYINSTNTLSNNDINYT